MGWSLSKYFPSRFIPSWLLTWVPGPYARLLSAGYLGNTGARTWEKRKGGATLTGGVVTCLRQNRRQKAAT